jgi:polyribonucleotide nucleotidyltransferase
MHKLEADFHGRRLVLETGRMAKQAGGAVLVQLGENVFST